MSISTLESPVRTDLGQSLYQGFPLYLIIVTVHIWIPVALLLGLCWLLYKAICTAHDGLARIGRFIKAQIG